MGDWKVDPALDEISRDGSITKLEPRMMQVLVCLAQHPGEVVSVGNLLDSVWKDLVVTQYSVYQAVAALRRALGDDPKEPRYIANVPRRGYRLIAPVGPDPRATPPAVEASLGAGLPASSDPEMPGHAVDRGPMAPPRVVATARWVIVVVMLLAALGTWWWLQRERHRLSARGEGAADSTGSNPAVAAAAPFRPPPHSLAVLPFTNLSGDPSQEYFSDGMSEELINALAQVEALQVIARTSSFSFKGKSIDIGGIARKLNVAAVLEGSVRRSGTKVRITAQLINAVTGFHIWSQDYDRDLNDVLSLQTEIATAVATELQAKLLADEPAKMELGGTHNVAAYDAYLHGMQLVAAAESEAAYRAGLAAFDQALALDPQFANAYVRRAAALIDIGITSPDIAARDNVRALALAAARRAVELAPDLGEAHTAVAFVRALGYQDFARAAPEYERSVALSPGNARVQANFAVFEGWLGHDDVAIAAARRALILDPENYNDYKGLAFNLYFARRFEEADATARELLLLNPDGRQPTLISALSYLGRGQSERARRACEPTSSHLAEDDRAQCLALAYRSLGRPLEAQQQLEKLIALDGDSSAYSYAEIYAQWGDVVAAMRWLTAAERLHDPDLQALRVDWMLDPLRDLPAFRALERRMNFPD